MLVNGALRRFSTRVAWIDITLKRMKRRGPIQTEPVGGAASSEEQPQVVVDVSSTQNNEEETQPSQTDLTLTPHVKTSVPEEEAEKLYEDTVDAVSTQNTDEEMQQIS
ncbi:unnamed protein product [Pleuronectes platessa]|uniref:Uncharacterized protein n=1 Tax=Pleuronectes platessa TaxID=8262 RepID=A0A9N7UFL9_PLEPL|nr:unnamed protein product [Pleuronectes platessa]